MLRLSAPAVRACLPADCGPCISHTAGNRYRRHNESPTGGITSQATSGWCPRVSRPDFLFECELGRSEGREGSAEHCAVLDGGSHDGPSPLTSDLPPPLLPAPSHRLLQTSTWSRRTRACPTTCPRPAAPAGLLAPACEGLAAAEPAAGGSARRRAVLAACAFVLLRGWAAAAWGGRRGSPCASAPRVRSRRRHGTRRERTQRRRAAHKAHIACMRSIEHPRRSQTSPSPQWRAPQQQRWTSRHRRNETRSGGA